MSVRIIPRLDIKGPNLVKGIHLEGLRVLGKPEIFANYYYLQGADELIYMDVVASLYQRNSILPLISRTAREVFIPLTVGGGLRDLTDIQMALRAGADKVSLNTAAISDPNLITAASERFGSSTITISIEAKKTDAGSYEAYTDNGREPTGVDAIEWAYTAAKLGAVELIVTSIDREGTGRGYDLELLRQVATLVDIPVIACGGAGNIGHVRDVIVEGMADAVAMSSVLHYGAIENQLFDNNLYEEGNPEYLQSQRKFSKVESFSLESIKDSLSNDGITVRPINNFG